MEQIIDTVERVRAMRNDQYAVGIDCSLRQGHRAIRAQLASFGETDVAPPFVDNMLKKIQTNMTALVAYVQPYQLPDAYIFFLEYYGGLNVGTADYGLQLYGVGPLAGEAYENIMSDEAFARPNQDGVIVIGNVTDERQHAPWHAFLFLDLAGIVQPDSILGVWNAGGGAFEPMHVIRNLPAYSQYWRIVAPSFPALLQRITDTRGDIWNQ